FGAGAVAGASFGPPNAQTTPTMARASKAAVTSFIGIIPFSVVRNAASASAATAAGGVTPAPMPTAAETEEEGSEAATSPTNAPGANPRRVSQSRSRARAA